MKELREVCTGTLHNYTPISKQQSTEKSDKFQKAVYKNDSISRKLSKKSYVAKKYIPSEPSEKVLSIINVLFILLRHIVPEKVQNLKQRDRDDSESQSSRGSCKNVGTFYFKRTKIGLICF